MIKDHQLVRKGDSILFGISLGYAVLDMVTTDAELKDCLRILSEPHNGLVDTRMGTFGIYPVSLNLLHDDTACIFIDGPYFDEAIAAAAGLYLDKNELRELIESIVKS